jgi:hypothetical protein
MGKLGTLCAGSDVTAMTCSYDRAGSLPKAAFAVETSPGVAVAIGRTLSTKRYWGRLRRREAPGAVRASAIQPRAPQGEACSSQNRLSGQPMVAWPHPSQ